MEGDNDSIGAAQIPSIRDRNFTQDINVTGAKIRVENNSSNMLSEEQS